MKRGIWILIVGFVIGGCVTTDDTESEPTEPSDLGQSLAALMSVEDCDDLLSTLQTQALEQMNQRIDENLEQTLELYEEYGAGSYCWNHYYGDYLEDAASGGSAPPSDPDSGAREYSETNTQVEGVDEADFVKNDGEYIYILADGRFQIIDAWPPETAHVISDYEVEGLPRKMFVHADRVVIYSSLEMLSSGGDYPPSYWDMVPSDSYDECTYGYNCEFTGDGRALKVTVLDISDLTNPVLIRETEFSGSLVNARRIGESVFSVVSFPQTALNNVSYWPEELWYGCSDVEDITEEEIVAMYEALRETNREIIEISTISDWVPGVTDTRYSGGEVYTDEGLLQSCEGFYVSQQDDGQSYLSLVAFDMTELGKIDVATTVGRPGAVYSSPSALYVASQHQFRTDEPWFFEGEDITQATTVHRFDLLTNPPAASYAGSGVVKGHVLNQFAMDEHNDNLRIATTTGHVPDPNVHSTVTVLALQSSHLLQIGVVDNIAPTEDIRSVRFDGDRGFVVTFKKTDPLFAIDLSDPTNPAILGELHIPGYSTYMHLMDEDHLLAIGFDAQDEGNFAWFQGILLQVFDISDMTNPTLTHREVIGSRGSTSEAATNHLAFNFFRARDWLALPMVLCEGGQDGSYGTQMTFGGLMIYEVTTADGFDYLGGVPHVEAEAEESAYSACGNWWTDSNSYVQRSIFMDDYVFSIAANSIEVAHADDFGVVLNVIPLLLDP